MAGRFIIITDSVSIGKAERDAITDRITEKGWNVWHWLEDLWLIGKGPAGLTPKDVFEVVQEVIPGKLTMVFSVKDIGTAGLVPETALPWLNEFWHEMKESGFAIANENEGDAARPARSIRGDKGFIDPMRRIYLLNRGPGLPPELHYMDQGRTVKIRQREMGVGGVQFRSAPEKPGTYMSLLILDPAISVFRGEIHEQNGVDKIDGKRLMSFGGDYGDLQKNGWDEISEEEAKKLFPPAFGESQ